MKPEHLDLQGRYSVKEAAAMSGLCADTVRRWNNMGLVPGCGKRGTNNQIHWLPKEAIDAWVKNIRPDDEQGEAA